MSDVTNKVSTDNVTTTNEEEHNCEHCTCGGKCDKHSDNEVKYSGDSTVDAMFIGAEQEKFEM